jgi:hypothetical protein
MNESRIASFRTASLPTTTADFLNFRKLKQKRTLNDQVEDLFLALYEKPDFQQFNEAVFNVQAVTGHLALEDGKLAEMIIDLAKLRGADEVAKQKPWTIVLVIRVVLRRYGLSRPQRRDMMHGETDGFGTADEREAAE